jgi:hypothetical protein
MNLQPIRVVIIEPNAADVHWFRLCAKAAGVAVEVIHYSTGISALKDWKRKADFPPDLIVVADVLPMLTLQEFIDAARAVHPAVSIAVIGEQTPVPVDVDGVERYTKPLSAFDIHKLCGYTTLAAGNSQVFNETKNSSSTSMTDTMNAAAA